MSHLWVVKTQIQAVLVVENLWKCCCQPGSQGMLALAQAGDLLSAFPIAVQQPERLGGVSKYFFLFFKIPLWLGF